MSASDHARVKKLILNAESPGWSPLLHAFTDANVAGVSAGTDPVTQQPCLYVFVENVYAPLPAALTQSLDVSMLRVLPVSALARLLPDTVG